MQQAVDKAIKDICQKLATAHVFKPFPVGVGITKVQNLIGKAKKTPIRKPNDFRIIDYKYSIDFNKSIFVELTDDEQLEAIIHEVAHVFVAKYVTNPSDLTGHGTAWRSIMKLYNLETLTCLKDKK